VGGNWLDSAIGFVAPERQLRRAQAREALDLLRSYDAAKRTRRTSGWRSAGTSANAEVVPSLSTVRNRSRELVRNNPYALRAVNVLAAKSIGTGIRARWPDGAAKVWAEFCDNCDHEGDLDFYGLQALMARTSFESGEVLIRRRRLREGRVPLRLQLLEADFIDGTKFGPVGENLIIGGVEVDKLGRRVAYWLWDQHPGEAGFLPRGLKSVRVEASEIILFGEKQRPGQVRFMPRMASSMMRLRDHDDYRDALIVKKKIEACFAAFVVGGNTSQPLGEASTNATTGKRTETLAPGIIEYLNAGSDVKFANPTAGGDDGFSEMELHAIAAGVGVTYEQLTGDLSKVNYSSIRAGVQDFRDLVDGWRWLQYQPMALRRIAGWFLEAAWTAGSIRTMNYNCVWTAPKWAYVDPVKDVEAERMEMRMGKRSLSDVIRADGEDPEEVFGEIAKERKDLKEKGVVVDSNAEVPTKGVQAPTEPEPDPANPKRPKKED
jgi:lambda family phage portal protein